MNRVVILVILFAGLAVAGVLYIAQIENKNGGRTAGPVIPRFASLRSGEANMRTGPGTRYPIEWVYKHQGLPVEIIAKDDDDIWRRVRDSEGAEGWIHKSELSGKRTALLDHAPHDLLKAASDAGAPVAHLEMGAVGQIMSCSGDWCRLKFEDIKGYLRKTEFWGAYADESFD